MLNGEREKPRGETNPLCCIFCQRPFLVPATLSKHMQGKSSCNRCVEIAWTLQQSHILSLQRPSRDELEEIGASLLKISQPCAGAFHQSSASTWSLTLWYDKVSDELLALLTAMQARFSLYNQHENEDILIFGPEDTDPKRTLGSLIKEILAHGNH